MKQNYFSHNFDMKDLGASNVILGLKIEHTHLITLKKSLRDLTILIANLLTLLFDTRSRLVKNKGESGTTQYSQVISCLNYIPNCTRLDIAYVVERLSRYTRNQNNSH